MAEQQPLKATFFAFQKRDKMVLLPATVTMIVLYIVLAGGFLFMSRGAIADYFTWAMSLMKQGAMSPGAPPSPEEMMPPASVMNLIPIWLLLCVVQYIVIAAWEAACLKWMIRGESGGLFGLSLGGDTWRVYFSYWLWFILLIVLYFVCIIVAAGAGISMLGAMQGKSEAASQAGPSVLIVLLICLALAAAFIYIAVRFAPAAATSVAERRFAFFDAWKVTRGRFWPLFGAFLLLYIMFIVGYFIVGIILGVLMATTLASSMGGAAGAGPTSPEQVMTMLMSPNFLVPIGIFYLVIFAAVMTFCIALFGINARAARAALEEGKITAAA